MTRDDELDGEFRLNLGCGGQTPAGWVNVDYALGARLAKVPLFKSLNRRFGLFALDWDDRIRLHDLRKPFPWPTGSVDIIYSSHTLEHLSRSEGDLFLAECARVLKSGGTIRIVVPDLAALVEQYHLGGVPSDRFLEELGVLYHSDKSRLKGRLAPFIQFPHKCMYDHPTLLRLLDDKGFDVAARGSFDSGIADIEAIELADRTESAVIVEGTKRG